MKRDAVITSLLLVNACLLVYVAVFSSLPFSALPGTGVADAPPLPTLSVTPFADVVLIASLSFMAMRPTRIAPN